MSPSNWLGRSGQSERLSGNGRSSRCSRSHLTLSLYRRQYRHLCPHYLQLSAMYRPFIRRCRTPVFLHYTSVYTIHFSLSATDPSHSVTNAGVTQYRLGYQRIRSGSRIRRDVYINSNSVCVCVSCVCVWLSGPYEQ